MPVTTRRAVLSGLVALTIVRSAVFVLAGTSHFDSDQAVTGLMAKHLSELRAFPVFWYGQTYMLGVEAWLAAPVMAILGPTVTALKLPLLAINVAVVVLLFQSLAEDGVEAWAAGFATLFFALTPPITAAHYLTANGGNVEPCLYVLLLWRLSRPGAGAHVTKAGPIWFGVVLGIGFLHREFTIYGAIAVLLVEAARRTLFTREAAARYALAFATAAGVWAVVLVLRHFSSAAGPGTSMADLSTQLAANNLLQLTDRLCLDGRAIAAGFGRLFTAHWPELFGLEPQPLTDFGIESTVRQGLAGAAWLLVPVFGIPAAALAAAPRAPRAPHAPPAAGACAYLMLVAALSLGGYLVGRCGLIDMHTMRYELLSPLGAAGLSGAFLRARPPRLLTAAWAACASLVFALALVSHARLIAEYATAPPVPAKLELVRALEARGVRYAYADYWTAYYVTFLARERIIVAADAVVKVRPHNRLVDEHRAEAIRISRVPCPGGSPLTPAFWACGT
jgi:hypothetical protein